MTRIRLGNSGPVREFSNTFLASFSTASGAATMNVDTSQEIPVSPYVSQVTFKSSPYWSFVGAASPRFKCTKAGAWELTYQVSLAKTVGAQAICLMPAKIALAGTNIFSPTFPLLIQNVETTAHVLTITNVIDLVVNDQVSLLAQRVNVVGGDLQTSGPILFSARPAAGFLRG